MSGDESWRRSCSTIYNPAHVQPKLARIVYPDGKRGQMNAHTPGPWAYVESDGSSEFGFVRGGETRDHLPVMQTYVASFSASSHYRPAEETRANARLIAAAPELLAACETMKRFVGSHCSGNPVEMTFPEAFQMLCDVCAKARGEGGEAG